MRYVMLPRKKRELYKAMQLGLAKKEARASELKVGTKLPLNDCSLCTRVPVHTHHTLLPSLVTPSLTVSR
jgi:hypothetical protein